MPPRRSLAVVLRAADFGELDKLVTFFTLGFGRLSGIAKGAKKSRRRFGTNLEPFSLVRLHFFDKEHVGLVRVDQCDLLASFQALRQDLPRLACGLYALELVRELTAERERHRELFTCLVRFLELLGQLGPRGSLVVAFELKLLALLGFEPQLTACVGCRQALPSGMPAALSVEKGGLLCARCVPGVAETIPVAGPTLDVWREALRAELAWAGTSPFSEAALAESQTLLPRFVEVHLGRAIRSRGFMEEVLCAR